MWAKNSADTSFIYFKQTYGNTFDYKKNFIGVQHILEDGWE